MKGVCRSEGDLECHGDTTRGSGLAAKAHPWPCGGGNANRSGLSLHIGTLDLSRPSWIFLEPDRLLKGAAGTDRVFVSSPVIDDDLNVYIQSSTGWVYALNARGQLRWSFTATSFFPGGLALLDDALYTVTIDGTAFKIDKDTGIEVWNHRVALTAPIENHALIAIGSTVLTACNLGPSADPTQWPGRPHSYGGGDAVCAIRTTDGSLIWTYSIAESSETTSYNQAPAVVGDAVLFSDRTGGVYSVSLVDGRELWRVPGPFLTSWTTGGLAVGPTGIVYAPANPSHPSKLEPGILRAFDLHSGAVLWSRRFHEGVNAKPAVGAVCCGEQPTHDRILPLAVVIAVGSNPSCDPLTQWSWLQQQLGLLPKHFGIVYALDAYNGSTIWTFNAPEHTGPCVGITAGDGCCPDMWGEPTIGADGTVYVNWSGGQTMALRDANGDGKVEPADPLEFSTYKHGLGSQSGTSIAPGLITMSNCKQLLGYLS